MCAVAYLRSEPKEYSADLAIVIRKCRVAAIRNLFIPRLELQAAVMAVRLKEQIVKEQKTMIHSSNFWTDSTTVLQGIHSSHWKQQVFVANRVAEILNTTNVSQWNHVSGINNPADIGTRAINVDEFKRSESLTGQAWLKQPESEWPEQVNLVFAADEENIPTPTFILQAEEKKPIVQWRRFSNFNRLLNTIACVHSALRKRKPATKKIRIEEKEDAKATIFRSLQQEQFAEETKSLKVEREIPKGSKILQFSPFIDQRGLIRAKGRTRKVNWTSTKSIQYFYIGNSMLWNYSCVTSTRTIPIKETEHVKNIVQQQFCIIGVRNALRSIKNKCITYRKGRAQTMTPVMAELPTERFDAPTAFAIVLQL